MIAPESLAHDQSDKLIFGGSNLGYGNHSDFLCLNKGNPLARLAANRLPAGEHHQSLEFLFCPDRDFYIALAHGKLHIAKNAAVSVIDDDGCVLVLNLLDASHKDVFYKEGNREYELQAGRFLLLQEKGAKLPVAIQQLPTRRVTMISIAGDHSILSGDFSETTALTQLPRIHALRSSKSAKESHLLAKLIKMAAIHQTVTSTHGPYNSFNQSLALTAQL
jgi:hypothetical protein